MGLVDRTCDAGMTDTPSMSANGAVLTCFAACTVLVLGFAPLLPAALIFVAGSGVLAARAVRRGDLTVGPVLGLLGATLAAEFVSAVASGEGTRLRMVVGGAAVGAAAVLLVRLVGRLSPVEGVGEVIYGGLAGSVLGWFGLRRVGTGLALAVVVGAVLAGPVLAHARRREQAAWAHRAPVAGSPELPPFPHPAGRPTAARFGGRVEVTPVLPMVPALALGTWLALLWGETFLRWYR